LTAIKAGATWYRPTRFPFVANDRGSNNRDGNFGAYTALSNICGAAGNRGRYNNIADGNDTAVDNNIVAVRNNWVGNTGSGNRNNIRHMDGRNKPACLRSRQSGFVHDPGGLLLRGCLLLQHPSLQAQTKRVSTSDFSTYLEQQCFDFP
jgi:hypothetical protein